jgi:phage baseplate assembly protein W
MGTPEPQPVRTQTSIAGVDHIGQSIHIIILA